MKTILASMILTAAALGFSSNADAAGCLKGAVVGGVAGHMAGGHGTAGAAAGCALGHHSAAKKAKQDDAQANQPNQPK